MSQSLKFSWAETRLKIWLIWLRSFRQKRISRQETPNSVEGQKDTEYCTVSVMMTVQFTMMMRIVTMMMRTRKRRVLMMMVMMMMMMMMMIVIGTGRGRG